jgi:DNA-binding winged helix-turn-helix (wHTH) protein
VQPRDRYEFGPFIFDARFRQLTRDGEEVTLSDRQAALLYHLVTQAGTLLPKEVLMASVWGDIAVTDNSLEQVVSALRRLLKDDANRVYLETVPRRGYRFAVPVTRIANRETDEELAALLAPHRAWFEGRAALERLDRGAVAGARATFERVLAASPHQAAAHLGLANACIMQFEMTRIDAEPDRAALERAATHAREACRLDPALAESWATLGFVLARTGQRLDALAASRRSVTLEADNWRHHFRLASIAWGEERLREARRTLSLLPGFPLAHFLASTVLVARGAVDEAGREIALALSTTQVPGIDEPRFSGVALHWLLGLIKLAEGDEEGALAAFERERALEASGHLYARECTANAWHATGAVHLRHGRIDAAREAFSRARMYVPAHPLAGAALAALSGMSATDLGSHAGSALTSLSDVDRALALATFAAVGALIQSAQPRPTLADAAGLVDAALATAEPGNAGWLLPLDPLLRPAGAPAMWASALARVRTRAA